MWMAAYGYNMDRKSPSELMASRMAFVTPTIFAMLFLLLDVYHVYITTDCSEMMTMDIAGLYGLAALRAINNYFPSTFCVIALFAVMQQGIYNVFSGFSVWKLDKLLIYTVVYAMTYAVYIVIGSEELLLLCITSIMTLVLGFLIWFSLEAQVRNSHKSWKAVMGS